MAYGGFPPRVRSTPVPNPLLGNLLEQIDDIAELKCTLRLIKLLHEKKGFPRYVSHAELLADPVLARGLAAHPGGPRAAVEDGMRLAVRRGVVIQASVGAGGVGGMAYLLNTEAGRRAVERIGSVEDVGAADDLEPFDGPFERPNVFAVYEDNIGMLNPMIAEELKDAEDRYPQDWIEEAFREAVKSNKRSWRYVAAVLERWEREGRGDGGSGRDTKTLSYKEYFRR